MVRNVHLPRRFPAVVEEFYGELWLYYGLGERTAYNYRQIIMRFDAWLGATAATCLQSATQVDVLRWVADLVANNEISPRTQSHYLTVLRRFYRFLLEKKRVSADPTAGVDMPKLRPYLPKVPSQDELNRLLSQIDISTPVGMRDKALLELLYATGLRCSELGNLLLGALNTRTRSIRVNGKGDVTRLVVYGREAASWINLYLSRARPALRQGDPRVDHVFLTPQGRPLQDHGVRAVVKKHSKQYLNKAYAPHALRHAFATHMLERGAEIQIIQKLLGHASPSSTQIYTHLTTQHLRQAHKFHPREARVAGGTYRRRKP